MIGVSVVLGVVVIVRVIVLVSLKRLRVVFVLLHDPRTCLGIQNLGVLLALWCFWCVCWFCACIARVCVLV